MRRHSTVMFVLLISAVLFSFFAFSSFLISCNSVLHVGVRLFKRAWTGIVCGTCLQLLHRQGIMIAFSNILKILLRSNRLFFRLCSLHLVFFHLLFFLLRIIHCVGIVGKVWKEAFVDGLTATLRKFADWACEIMLVFLMSHQIFLLSEDLPCDQPTLSSLTLLQRGVLAVDGVHVLHSFSQQRISIRHHVDPLTKSLEISIRLELADYFVPGCTQISVAPSHHSLR